jgi:hypothetical protein
MDGLDILILLIFGAVIYIVYNAIFIGIKKIFDEKLVYIFNNRKPNIAKSEKFILLDNVLLEKVYSNNFRIHLSTNTKKITHEDKITYNLLNYFDVIVFDNGASGSASAWKVKRNVRKKVKKIILKEYKRLKKETVINLISKKNKEKDKISFINNNWDVITN